MEELILIADRLAAATRALQAACEQMLADLVEQEKREVHCHAELMATIDDMITLVDETTGELWWAIMILR